MHPALFCSPTLVVPKRANIIVRTLLKRSGQDGAVSQVCDDSGTVIAEIRPKPRPRTVAGIVGNLFVWALSVALDSSGRRDPNDLLVFGHNGELLLQLVCTWSWVRVLDADGTELGWAYNEANRSGDRSLVRLYGPCARRQRRFNFRIRRGELLAEASCPVGVDPDFTFTDPSGRSVFRTRRIDGTRVALDVLADDPSRPRALSAGFACSLVEPDWVRKPARMTGGDG